MEYTKYLKLYKPSYDDDVDIQILNKNMDIIDGKVGDLPYLPLKGGLMTGNIWFNRGIGLKYGNQSALNFTMTGWKGSPVETLSIDTEIIKFYPNKNKSNVFLVDHEAIYYGGKKALLDMNTLIGSHEGYTKFSNGVIIQWGFVSTTTQGAVEHVTFKTPMSNANYVTFVNKSNGTGTAPSHNNGEWWSATYNLTTTGFDVICDTVSYGDKQMWLVIGG